MEKKIVKSGRAPAPIGPYNQAVWANDTLYVSGQIAIDQQTGEMINNSIAGEINQVMKNLSYILEEAGLTFKNVVKCSIFIKNMDEFSLINEIYSQYFDQDAPARETVEVSGLPKDVSVEISCIAIK